MIYKKTREAVLIINTRARKAKACAELTQKLLVENGISLKGTYLLKQSSQILYQTKSAIKRSTPLVIIGSGDGTISSIAGLFIKQKSTLGIIPLGTSNSFAKSLNIPLDIETAVKTLITGKVIRVDVGKVNNKYFANVANIGLSAIVAKHTSPLLKKILSRLAFYVSAVQALFTFHRFDITMTANKKTIRTRAYEIILANGQFQGGVMIAPTNTLHNNKLLVTTIEAHKKLDILTNWFLILIKQQKTFPRKNHFYTNQVSIKVSPKQYLDIDGEALKKVSRVQVSIIPRSMRVLVPR